MAARVASIAILSLTIIGGAAVALAQSSAQVADPWTPDAGAPDATPPAAQDEAEEEDDVVVVAAPRVIAPTPPPTDFSMMLGLDMQYMPSDNGGPALGDVEASFDSTTLKMGYFDVRTVMFYQPIAKASGADYGNTQACFFCASLGVRLAHLRRDTWLTLGLDYDWIYLGAGRLDTYRRPAAGGELGVMVKRGPYHGFARFSLQGLFVDGYGGSRLGFELGGWYRLTSFLAAYGRIGYAGGTVDATADSPEYNFGGPILQLGLAWTP